MPMVSRRQRDLYEQLAQHHAVEHRPYREVAEIMRVSERTVRRWAKSGEYQRILEEMRAEWRSQSGAAVENIARSAVRVLVEIMNDRTVRPHVRYECAAKLGDWAGLGQRKEAQEEDDRAALVELYKILEETRQPTVNIQLPPGSTISTPPQLSPGEVVEGEARPVDTGDPS